MAKKIIINLKEFKEKAIDIHNNFYKYDLVNFENYNDNINIICPIHGIFEQKLSSHLKGKKCRKCFHMNRNSNLDKLILRFKKAHGERYDYSLVNYINSTTNVKIICKIHGVFEQNPMSHARGRNCQKCSGPGSNKYNIDNIISKFIEVHGNKYNYNKVDYINYDIKVKIICPKHGVFEQKPSNHIRGNGCPKCTNKIEAKILKLINRDNISFLNREIINPLELDIVDLNNKFAIEFNGILYHSYGNNKNKYLDNLSTININKHYEKLLLCKEKGFSLINVNEIYWYKYNSIISNLILVGVNKLENFKFIKFEDLTYINNYKYTEVINFNKVNNYRLYSTNFSNNVSIFYKDELVITILFNLIEENIYVDNIVLKSGIIIDNYINFSISILQSLYPNNIYFFNYNDLEFYSNRKNYIKTLSPNEYYTSKKLKKLKIITNSKNAFIENINLKYKSSKYSKHSGRFYYDTGWDVYLFKKEC